MFGLLDFWVLGVWEVSGSKQHKEQASSLITSPLGVVVCGCVEPEADALSGGRVWHEEQERVTNLGRVAGWLALRFCYGGVAVWGVCVLSVGSRREGIGGIGYVRRHGRK